jgi:hypothetical protein
MKPNKKTITGFFTNLSGVILGILLTFGVNALYQHREESSKVKEMLTLVRNELQTNKIWFEYQKGAIRRDSEVYKKVLDAKGNWKAWPQDSLEAYYIQTMYIQFTQLTTSAWQIFQNAETTQKMKDKELIIRLADCYFWINKVHDLIMEEYWAEKKKNIVPEVDRYKYFDAIMDKKEAVFFYTHMSTDAFGTWNLFPLIDAIIDYTLRILDERGNYQYDMTDEDKAFEDFVQARIDSVQQARP